MCTMYDLPAIKEKILEEIKVAAQNADMESITKWSKAAEQYEILIKENEELENRMRTFVGTFSTERSNTKTQSPISPKREGAMVREMWVKKLLTKDIPLTGHSKRYYTRNHTSVSIAFANELYRPNKWFLGLKDEPADFAVLLCQEKKGYLHDFIIPVAELGSAWEALSRSGEQVKINIKRESSEFLLLIPGDEPLIITKYDSNYKPLNGL